MFNWLRRERNTAPVPPDPKELLAYVDSLRQVAMQGADTESLRAALAAADAATRCCTDPADQAVAWSMVCVLDRTAAVRTGEYSGLDTAELAGRRGLALAPAGSPVWFRCAAALSTVLMERHLRLGDPAALPAAVDLSRRIVAELDIDSPQYPGMLGNLTNALKLLYGVRRDPALIEEAVVTAREAVELSPPGSPDFVTVRVNLASALAVQLYHTPSRALLDEARGHLRTALAALPAGHPERSTVQTLATQLERAAGVL